MPQIKTYHHVTSDVDGEKGDEDNILYSYNENKEPSDFYGTVEEHVGVMSEEKRLVVLHHLTLNDAGEGQISYDDLNDDLIFAIDRINAMTMGIL